MVLPQLGYGFSHYWTILIHVKFRSVKIHVSDFIVLLPLKISCFAWSAKCVRFSVFHFIIRLLTPTWLCCIFSIHVHFVWDFGSKLSKDAALTFFLAHHNQIHVSIYSRY